MKQRTRAERPRLRAERRARVWTQQYVASEIGVTVRAYQNYEYCEKDPSLGVANKLEDLFGIPQRELLVRDDCNAESEKTKAETSCTA